MTTKQNPTVKVGDMLIFSYGHGLPTVRPVTKITPTGILVTDHYRVDPDLRIRGLSAWSSVHSHAELATPERLAEIDRQANYNGARVKLQGWNWSKVPGPVALEVLQTLRRLLKESEAKDAQEKSE